MSVALPFSWRNRKTIVITSLCIVATIYYLKYRLEPMRIYPLDPEHTNYINITKRKNLSSLDIHPPIYDTVMGKDYIIEGYLSDDTAAIKKAILSFLAKSSGLNLHSKTIWYSFKFCKSNGKFNKNYILDEGEYADNDIFNNEIASVDIYHGEFPNCAITYFDNRKITYGEQTLNNGTIIREKYKNGVELIEDRYMPNGTIEHKDLSKEWDSIMKEMGK